MPAIAVSLALVALGFQAESFQRKTFEDVHEVALDLNFGECKLTRSRDSKVHVEWVWNYPEGTFDAFLDVSANQVVHPRSGKLRVRPTSFQGVSGEPS